MTRQELESYLKTLGMSLQKTARLYQVKTKYKTIYQSHSIDDIYTHIRSLNGFYTHSKEYSHLIDNKSCAVKYGRLMKI